MKIGVTIIGIMAFILFVVLPTKFSKRELYVVEAVVTGVGSCGGGEGFFSGNYECAVKAVTKDGEIYTNVYGQVVVGQPIYKHCWVENSGNKCFSVARKTIDKRWAK